MPVVFNNYGVTDEKVCENIIKYGESINKILNLQNKEECTVEISVLNSVKGYFSAISQWNAYDIIVSHNSRKKILFPELIKDPGVGILYKVPNGMSLNKLDRRIKKKFKTLKEFSDFIRQYGGNDMEKRWSKNDRHPDYLDVDIYLYSSEEEASTKEDLYMLITAYNDEFCNIRNRVEDYSMPWELEKFTKKVKVEENFFLMGKEADLFVENVRRKNKILEEKVRLIAKRILENPEEIKKISVNGLNEGEMSWKTMITTRFTRQEGPLLLVESKGDYDEEEFFLLVGEPNFEISTLSGDIVRTIVKTDDITKQTEAVKVLKSIDDYIR